MDEFALDPRPDLTEDAEHWRVVLVRAAKRSDDLLGLLRGFRAYGAKLTTIDDGYKLVARYAPNGGWANLAEWLTDRENYLIPQQKALTEILSNKEQAA